MDKYKIDDEKIATIARTFGTDRETVKKMNAVYKGISDGMKYQYLAHVIRTVEEKVRMELHNPLFQIQCIPVDKSSALTGFGSAQYFEQDCYLIYYHPNLDDKQLRILIAHELGHLVVEVLVRKSEDPNKDCSEPLSSILGILTILDKNDFYQCRASQYQHSSWQDIIKDFSLLKNQTDGIYNMSK